MADIIDVNIGDSTLEVFWQDEVELNLDMALMYIKSGEAEIQKYVDEVSKPEISNYVETEAKPLVSKIVEEIAEPTVAEYIETTVKPDLDEYADSLKPDLQAYVTQASNYADNSQASAGASAASAAAALTSANNAKTSETNAKTYENNALNSKNAAASSATSASNYANNSKIWAEGTDAQVQALGGSKSAKGWAEASTNLDYTNITNCITAIPQDIKLELNNGTLTLKAGSKVYVPNGVGQFDEVIIQQDISASNFGSASGLTIVCVKGISLKFAGDSQSGDTIPSGNCIWYDTQNNRVVSVQNGSINNTGYSLPIGFVVRTNGNFTSIDQVFNGFGYIGSTIFALPGVEGLIPNGRNTDGSLNNIKVTITRVVTDNRSINGNVFFINTAGGIAFANKSNYVYDELSNFNKNGGTKWLGAFSGYYTTDSTGRITSFKPKTVFQATDYYDVPKLAGDNTFTGSNTFSPSHLNIKNYSDDLSVTPANSIGSALYFKDKNDKVTSYIQNWHENNGKNSIVLGVYGQGGQRNFLFFTCEADGTSYATAPTPTTSSNSTQIATTQFVNNFFNTSGRVTGKCVPNYGAGVGIGTGSTVIPKDSVLIIKPRQQNYANLTVTVNGVEVFRYNGDEYLTLYKVPILVPKNATVVITGNLSNATYYPLVGA